MRFEDILKSVADGRGQIPEGWGQGRAAFGGLVAAMAWEHLAQNLTDPGPVRSLAVSFVAPGEAGEARFEHELLRQGKSATQATARLIQGNQVRTMMLASFGRARESAIAITPQPAPEAPAPDDCLPFPFIEGVTPDFTRHFEFRWSTSDLPMTGSGNGEIGGWVRLRAQQQPAPSVAWLLALVDAWPPAVLPMFRKPAPISSLSWYLELVNPPGRPAPEGWWRYHAWTDAAADGYAFARAGLWGADGELVAISRQTVALFG